MKGSDILLDHLGSREAAALMIDGHLHDLFVQSDAPAPGTIYRARMLRAVKGQGGAFLDTPDGTVFLRRAKGLVPGKSYLVQVSGYSEPGKAIPVTDRLLFKSRFAIVTPDAPGFNVSRQIRDEERREALLLLAHEALDAEEGMGLILRSSCARAEHDEIAQDIAQMADLARQITADDSDTGTPEALLDGDAPHVLAWREWHEFDARPRTNSGCFEEAGVLDALDALDSPRVPLPGGGDLYVEPTRALIAVDVNTGADGSHAAGLKANLAAARELPRQLRLRGLGGQVVMDLAPMAKKDRRGFESALRAAFRADPVETALVGFTPLGNYELQRQRQRTPF